MKRFAIIIVVLVGVAVLAVTTYDAFRWRSFLGRVRSIQVGDTKEQVLATMGQATGVFTPPQEIVGRLLGLGVRVETWAYGKHFDWRHCFHLKFPYFWPLKFRLLGPDADDVKIEFDSAGRVSRISMPRT